MSHSAEYDRAVKRAYDELLADMRDIIEGPDLDSNFKEMRRITGICGQKCGAAAKRYKRAVVLDELTHQAKLGQDITPTVAGHFFENLIGRGVDGRKLIEVFGKPGRTAADKTDLTAADLSGLEAVLGARLKEAQVTMASIRKMYADEYAILISKPE